MRLVVDEDMVHCAVCLSTDLWNTMMVVWVSKVRIAWWGAHATMDKQKEPADDVLGSAHRYCLNSAVVHRVCGSCLLLVKWKQPAALGVMANRAHAMRTCER